MLHCEGLLFRCAAISAGTAIAGRRLAVSVIAAITFDFTLFERTFDFLYHVGGDFFLTHDGSRTILFSADTVANSKRPFSYSYDCALFKLKSCFFVGLLSFVGSIAVIVKPAAIVVDNSLADSVAFRAVPVPGNLTA